MVSIFKKLKWECVRGEMPDDVVWAAHSPEYAFNVQEGALFVSVASSGFSEWEKVGHSNSASYLKKQAQAMHEKWVASFLTPAARKALSCR